MNFSRVLVEFERPQIAHESADFGEKIGNGCLGLLRLGLGKVVKINKEHSSSKVPYIEKESASISEKIGALALLILSAPITVFIVSVGLIGTAVSKSHSSTFANYHTFEGIRNTLEFNNGAPANWDKWVYA